MTRAEYLALVQKAPSKWRNKPVTVDGVRFDSGWESECWFDLKNEERGGRIKSLKRQVDFKFELNGVLIGAYRADFSFNEKVEGEWVLVVADAKGALTDVYKLKRKMMLAFHQIKIREYYR